MKGEIITSIDRIMELAEQKKSVIYRHTGPKAAAFFINWRVKMLNEGIKCKNFHEYIKQDKN